MKTEIRLSQEEVAQLVASVLGYNGLHASDIAFDITSGSLEVVATVNSQTLKVRNTPESEDYTGRLLERMRANRGYA